MHHTGNLFCKDISAAQQKYPCSDANGTAFFQQAIKDEDPDVFVFTGDNICSGDIFGGQNALDGLLVDFVKATNTVPWLAVEGNHDVRDRSTRFANITSLLLAPATFLPVLSRRASPA